MVRLYKDPTGTVVLNHAAHDMGNTGASVVGTLNENQIHELKMKVKRLEAQLAEHKTDTVITLTSYLMQWNFFDTRKGPSYLGVGWGGEGRGGEG